MEKNIQKDSYSLRINLFNLSSYGTSYQYIAHLFLDGKYFNSTALEHPYEEAWRGTEGQSKLINDRLITPLLNKTDYSWKKKLQKTDKEKNCEVFEFLITKGKKSAFQKLKEKFLESSGKQYYKDYYSIRDIEEGYITSTCWDATHRDETQFNVTTMPEQSKALEKYVEEYYGVKIKVIKTPTYREMKSSLGVGRIRFPFEIKKITDESKLKLKEEPVDFDLVDFLNEIMSWSNSYRDEKENDVLNCVKPKKKTDIYTATDAMFRNPGYMYVVKEFEKDLIEDFDNYKNLLLREVTSEASYCHMNIRMFSNFKKLMPELYVSMFGNIPTGLIPVAIYKKCKSEDLNDIINNFKIPELI